MLNYYYCRTIVRSLAHACAAPCCSLIFYSDTAPTVFCVLFRVLCHLYRYTACVSICFMTVSSSVSTLKHGEPFTRFNYCLIFVYFTTGHPLARSRLNLLRLLFAHLSNSTIAKCSVFRKRSKFRLTDSSDIALAFIIRYCLLICLSFNYRYERIFITVAAHVTRYYCVDDTALIENPTCSAISLSSFFFFILWKIMLSSLESTQLSRNIKARLGRALLRRPCLRFAISS